MKQYKSQILCYEAGDLFLEAVTLKNINNINYYTTEIKSVDIISIFIHLKRVSVKAFYIKNLKDLN